MALFAQRAMLLGPRVQVVGGDIGVAELGGPYLHEDFALALMPDTMIDAASDAISPSVLLQNRASTGALFTDRLVNRGGSYGQLAAFLPMPPMPAATLARPGMGQLVVEPRTTRELAPTAAYGTVRVKSQGILRLTGGLYEFGTMSVESQARVEIEAAVTIRIRKQLDVGSKGYLGPVAGRSLTSRDLFVESSADDVPGPWAIRFDAQTTARAVVLAPTAKIHVQPEVEFKGALIGRSISVEPGSRITFEGGLAGCAMPCSDPDAWSDDNPCTSDTCDVVRGVIHTPLPNGSACSDDDSCTQTDACQAGVCAGANPVTCVASDQCHGVGVCDPGTGICSDPLRPDGTACNDANACTLTDVCQGGMCTGTEPVLCAAIDACHDVGLCAPATGVCSNPALPNGTPCNDEDVCNGSEACSEGVCLQGVPPELDDGNPCTVDSCDATVGAQHEPVAVGTPCPDADACNGAETCDSSGACQPGTAVVCVSADACHDVGVCDPATGVCSAPPKPDATPCDDGNACTQTDSCDGGSCVGTSPVTCPPPDECHEYGTCDPETGACSTPVLADGTHCEDGNLCTTGDTCQQGVCSAGAEVVCVAQNDCELPGTCGPATGQCSPGTLDPSCGLPPDPATIAPPLDATVTTTVFDAVSFLFESPTPVQTDVTPGAIDPLRASLLRGKVRTRDGTPLGGVLVEVLGSPDTGRTLTREDGQFDLVLNGGGTVVLKYTRATYLPVQRQLEVDWSEYSTAPEVVMIGYDPVVSHVDLAQPTVTTATGSVVTDDDGTREATVMFMPGTTATITRADGTQEELTQLSLRLTEYTVGEDGEAAMPATLPPAVAYTYAVEISSDEALDRAMKQNGVDTVLNQPVSYYLTNFLGFNAGAPIPVGYYDGDKGQWIAEDSGVVLDVLSTDGGVATIDSDGDGLEDTEPRLVALGISTEELAALAERYQPGDSLWRMRLSHFSSFDFNLGWGLPTDADYWDETPQTNVPNPTDCSNFGWDTAHGSIMECSDQILGEALPIVGTPFSLNYRSDRVPGRRASRIITVPVTPATTFPSLNRTEVMVTVAGQTFQSTVDGNEPRQTVTFEWDGRDAYGRTVLGRQNAVVKVGYSFTAARYALAPRFGFGVGQGGSGVVGGAAISQVPTRRSAVLWHTKGVVGVENWDARSMGIGGWDIDVHHHYDRVGRNIRLGDGRVRTAATAPWQVKLLGGSPGSTTHDLAHGPDGSVYGSTLHGHVVWRRRPSGEMSVVAGGGPTNDLNFLGDGGPATEALVWGPTSIAVAPDGGLYIAGDRGRIRYVSPDGIISTFAGTGAIDDQAGGAGVGGTDNTCIAVGIPVPREQAAVGSQVLALAPDGALYTAGGYCGLRKITPDGMITNVTPPEWPRDWYNWRLLSPSGLAVTKDGTVIVGFRAGCIAAISPTRGYHLIAGDAAQCLVPPSYRPSSAPDGAPVRAVPDSMAVDHNGDIYLVEGRLLRKIFDGALTTLAELPQVLDKAQVDVTPDGKIFLSASQIGRVEPPLPDLSLDDAAVASEDGLQLFVFDRQGRHLRTTDTLLGFDIYSFDYNGAGRLATIRDAYGATTTLGYDGAGNPATIAGPFGQVTQLAVDSNGFLSEVVSPGGSTWDFIYDDGGLMQRSYDPRNGERVFGFDSLGRLTSDRDPAMAEQLLSRSDMVDETMEIPRILKTGHEVSRRSGEGRTSGYREELLPTDERRQTSLHPDGTESVFTRRLTGAHSTSLPDGSTERGSEVGDPRFGTQAPLLATASTTTPLGVQRTTRQTRTATLGNSADPLSVTTLVEGRTVNGRTETTTFTASGRRVETVSPAGRRQTVYLDTRGNPVRVEVPGLASVVYGYDGFGRLTSSDAGSGVDVRSTIFGYDAAGWLALVTDAENRTATFVRDLDGRVLFQSLPGERTIGFTYDESGNVLSITPPGKPAHEFDYGPVDLMSLYDPPSVASVSDPSTSYVYDLDRNVTMVQRPDDLETDYQYDAAGRLHHVALAAGYGLPDEAISFAYDAETGQLASIDHSAGVSIDYGYDGLLVTSEVVSGVAPAPIVVSRGFDADFRLASESIDGAFAVSFGYDPDSLLTSAGALTLARSSQNGLLTGTTLGVIADAWTYNSFAEPLSYVARAGGTVVFSTSFARDRLGRITQKVETVDGVTSVYGYSYDLSGRLEAVDKDGVQVSAYGYDDNGNRVGGFTSFPEPRSISASYDDQDRLLSYGATTFTYTDNGELRTKTENGETTTYAYDAMGSLRTVSLPDGRLVEYLVDGRGRRVGKRVDGILVQGFIYGSQLAPIVELDGNGNIVARFVYGTKVNVPEYMIRGGVTYRIITDHLGSPRAVIDTGSGAIVQRADYDEWGVVLSDSNPGFTPFGFAGGVYDGDTGLVRFGARDYDAGTGRWTAKDPILLGPGPSLYEYSLSDSVNIVDPDGNYAMFPLAMISVVLFRQLMDIAVFVYDRFDEDKPPPVGQCEIGPRRDPRIPTIGPRRYPTIGPPQSPRPISRVDAYTEFRLRQMEMTDIPSERDIDSLRRGARKTAASRAFVPPRK